MRPGSRGSESVHKSDIDISLVKHQPVRLAVSVLISCIFNYILVKKKIVEIGMAPAGHALCERQPLRVRPLHRNHLFGPLVNAGILREIEIVDVDSLYIAGALPFLNQIRPRPPVPAQARLLKPSGKRLPIPHLHPGTVENIRSIHTPSAQFRQFRVGAHIVLHRHQQIVLVPAGACINHDLVRCKRPHPVPCALAHVVGEVLGRALELVVAIPSGPPEVAGI